MQSLIDFARTCLLDQHEVCSVLNDGLRCWAVCEKSKSRLCHVYRRRVSLELLEVIDGHTKSGTGGIFQYPVKRALIKLITSKTLGTPAASPPSLESLFPSAILQCPPQPRKKSEITSRLNSMVELLLSVCGQISAVLFPL